MMAHRVITYFVGITSTISAAVLLSFIGDVREGKEKLIRFEDIPAKLDKISEQVNNIAGRTALNEYRIDALEKKPTKSK